jgi:hypothetical protein
MDRNPLLLAHVLRYIDRNTDHLDSYTNLILTGVKLHRCRLTSDDINILGKWLINRPVDHPASQIARYFICLTFRTNSKISVHRRVLCSANWGFTDDVENSISSSSKKFIFWIDQDVHDACADSIVKAHVVHCKSRNSSIYKSVSKATRMVSRCADKELEFDKFCWDVLARLKISQKVKFAILPISRGFQV